MAIGRYEYALDAKNRMNFPPKFREEMGETLFITKWIDDCIVVFGEEKWQKFEEKLSELPTIKAREVQRYFYSNAQNVTFDKQGRILLTTFLKEHAGLKKDVLVLGVGDHAEIWDRDKYNEHERATPISEMLEILEI